MKVLKGKELSDKIIDEFKNKIKPEEKPCMATIRVGEDKGAISYEKSIKAKAKKANIDIYKLVLDQDVREEEVIEIIEKLNRDSAINGILVFRPLPPNLNEEKICNSIEPKKDIDGANTQSLHNLMVKNTYRNVPATALAIKSFIEDRMDIKGKNILIINRSLVIGKPLGLLLLNDDATVTMAHSKSKNIESILQDKDVIISAVGQANIFKFENLKPACTIIDMGLSYKDGKYFGDLDESSLENQDVFYVPSIGGIGGVTTSIILRQTYENYIDQEEDYE